MSRRGLLMLLAVTALAVIAVVLGQGGEPDSQPQQGLLLPELREQLDRVAQVELLRAGGESVTLRAGPDGWGVEERGGYPADTGKVRRLLLELAAVRTLEPKTREPGKYHYLGVQDLDQPQAAGTLVRLADARGRPLASVIVGEAAADGVYVRRTDAQQSWLAAGVPALQAEPGRWVNRELVQVPAAEVKRVAARPAQGAGFVLARRDGELALVEPPQAALVDRGRAQQLFELLAGLEPVDVRAAAGLTLSEPGQLAFDTADGLRLQLRHAMVDGLLWSRWEAGVAPGLEGEAAAAAQRRAETLNARLGPWAFELPEYLRKRLNLTLPELSQPQG